MKSFYLLLTMLLMVPAFGQDEEARAYCGRMLASAQSLYCPNMETINQEEYVGSPSSGKFLLYIFLLEFT